VTRSVLGIQENPVPASAGAGFGLMVTVTIQILRMNLRFERDPGKAKGMR
jgi:hypothetical protein